MIFLSLLSTIARIGMPCSRIKELVWLLLVFQAFTRLSLPLEINPPSLRNCTDKTPLCSFPENPSGRGGECPLVLCIATNPVSAFHQISRPSSPALATTLLSLRQENLMDWLLIEPCDVSLLSWRGDYRLAVGRQHMNLMQGNAGRKKLPNDLFFACNFKGSRLVGGLLMVTADNRISIS